MPFRSGSYEQKNEWHSPFEATNGKNTSKNKRQDGENEMFKEVEEWSRKIAGHLGISLPDQIECSNVTGLVPQINCDAREFPAFPAFNNDETFIIDWNRDRIPRGVKNMSDWSLKVYNGTEAKVYELHKNVLSLGPRRSMFFIREFEEERHRRQSGMDVTSATISEVALPKKAASCMPQFLDYIYRDEIHLNKSNAVALKFLANHFDVRPLFTTTIAFIEKDLTSKTALIYMDEADLMKDKDIANIAMKLAAEKLGELPQDSFMNLSPILFQRLVSHSAIMCTPEHLSEIIAAYVRNHPLEMNHELFFLLTNANILPRISSTEAFWYLAYAAETFRGILLDESFGGSKGSLKGRCIFAIASQWRNNLLPVVGASLDQRGSVNQIEKSKVYRNLPTDIKIELLEHVLLSAGGMTNDDVCKPIDSFQPARKDVKECRDDLNDDIVPPSSHSRNAKTVKKKYRPDHQAQEFFNF